MATSTHKGSVTPTKTAHLTENIGEFLDQAKEMVSHTREALTDSVTDAFETVQEVAEDSLHTANKKFKAAAKSAKSVAKKYPFEAVLVGVGVGAALGWLLASRR